MKVIDKKDWFKNELLRAEFEEKFCYKDDDGKPHNIWYTHGTSPREVWEWIEEQPRQARIAENDWFKKAVEDEAVMIDDKGKECLPDGDYERGTHDTGTALLKRIAKRIKESEKL